MAQPSGSSVHVPKPLPNVSVAYIPNKKPARKKAKK